MSIGISYILEDRVLLITDSRQVEGFGTQDKNVVDDAEKIYDISHQIAAIGVGIRQGIEIAVNTLKASVDENSSLERVSNALVAGIEVGWKGLQQIVASDVDITAPYFKLGLLIGGVAENRLFLMGLVRSHNSRSKPLIRTGNFDGITMGLENLEVSDRFGTEADKIFIDHKHSKDRDNNDLLTKKILFSTHQTVREIAGDNELISDKITHTIIWK